MAGGRISEALIHGLTVRESATDGSDFSNPAADHRRLFLGEDGQLHVKDSAGSVTDIGAGSGSALVNGFATVATGQSTTSTTYTDLATSGPAVTLTVNTKVKVTLTALVYVSNVLDQAFMGCAVSGASTVAAADAQSMRFTHGSTSENERRSTVIVYTGLTPGSTTFTAKYRTVAGDTPFFEHRDILVECLD